MFNKTRGKCEASILICSAILLCISAAGCKKGEQEAAVPSPAKVTIQNSGSDTMVDLAQAWAEQYAKIKPCRKNGIRSTAASRAVDEESQFGNNRIDERSDCQRAIITLIRASAIWARTATPPDDLNYPDDLSNLVVPVLAGVLFFQVID